MNKSECLITSLMFELDSLISRAKNINQTYTRTSNNNLRDRLLFENETIRERIKEISSFAEFLIQRSEDETNLSKLLAEKCKRSNLQKNIQANLFFH